MDIRKLLDGTALTLALDGRLDTSTSPLLEQVVTEDLVGITAFTLDLKELDYISSAGLRVLLLAQKKMNRQGKMILKNVSAGVMEIFEITGFVDVLTIE